MEESSFDDLIVPSTSSRPRAQEAFSWTAEEEPNPFADLQSSSVYAPRPSQPARYHGQISSFESRPQDSQLNGVQDRQRNSGDDSKPEHAQTPESAPAPLSPTSASDSPLFEESQSMATTLGHPGEAVAMASSVSQTPSSPSTLSATPSTQPIEGSSTPAYDRVLVSPFRASDVEGDPTRLGITTAHESSGYFPQTHSISDADSARDVRADDASMKTVGLESDQASVFNSKVTVQTPISDARSEVQCQEAGGRPTFIITVGDPQKIGSEITASAHTVYTVRTRVSMPNIVGGF
jgi:sorting nexin-1/2